MAQLLQLPHYSENRGDLTVLEDVLPGSLNRVFYITNADGSTRGGHRHKEAWQAIVCLQGSVDIFVDSGRETAVYQLNTPQTCLVLQPNDWKRLENFRDNAIVLVASNKVYDEADYIDERPIK